jgi:hypothetical protein
MVPVPQANREVLMPVWPRATISAALNSPVTGGIAAAQLFDPSHAAATPITDLAKKSLRLMEAPPKKANLPSAETLE